MCQSQSLLRKRTSLALNILQILGFVINWEKSELNSVQMIYLGLLSNSMLMQVSLPDKKIKKLKKQAGSLLWRKEFSTQSCFVYRPGKFYNPSCMAGSTMVQKSSDVKDKATPHQRVLRCPSKICGPSIPKSTFSSRSSPRAQDRQLDYSAAHINKMEGTRSYLLNSITKIFGYGVWKETSYFMHNTFLGYKISMQIGSRETS